MWSKITLKMKITLLTALALTLVTAGVTVLSIYNVRQSFNVSEYTIEFPPYLQGEHFVSFIQSSQSDFQTDSIIFAVMLIFIGVIAAYVISGQTLKPIKSLAEKIEDIDANNLDTLIEPPKSHDEITRLTLSFNSMLGKLNRSFENQKHFAQNAAHELKTPLASIMANIEVLQLDDEPTTEEYKEVIDTVKNNTEQLIKLVQGLLSINSITDETAWQTFNGKEMFADILSDLERDISQKRLNVSLSGECRIKGDKALLERAFTNLTHNAVRYNVDNGKININLSDESIIIEDSGVGIAAEDLKHIFEPFFVADKSRTKDLGGHGLGMAITKNIFDKHRMEIRIFSELDKGTKIIIKNNFE